MIDISTIQPIAEQVVTLYRKQLEMKGINASHELSRTADAIVEMNGTKLLISLNLNEYWKYVEYGRRPGKMPPIDNITEWIRIKPIVPYPYNGRVPGTRQLAYLIARKIGREGTDARKPLTEMCNSDAMEDIIILIKNEIVRQLRQQLLAE